MNKELRKINSRKRNLAYDQSLRSPSFLQLKFAIKAVKEYFDNLPKNEILRIYDFGCGEKPYQVFVGNHEYIGIDIDTENKMADIYSDIKNVPIEDGVADIVVSFYALEHVDDPQKVLNEKFRILKKNGRLFMLVPLYWEEHEQPYDFFRFTRYGIEAMMKKAGFKNIKVVEVNTFPSILGINLIKIFSRGFLKIFIPIINFIFYKIEMISLKKCKQKNIKSSNVMTFSVEGEKNC